LEDGQEYPAMTKSDKVLVILFRYLLGIGSRISFAQCIRG
jgi:hypothetical protein